MMLLSLCNFVCELFDDDQADHYVEILINITASFVCVWWYMRCFIRYFTVSCLCVPRSSLVIVNSFVYIVIKIKTRNSLSGIGFNVTFCGSMYMCVKDEIQQLL